MKNKLTTWMQAVYQRVSRHPPEKWIALESKDGKDDEEDLPDLKKYNAHPTHPRRKTINRVIIIIFCLSCVGIGNIFYYLSLATGTLDWVHAHMQILARNMILAVLFYFVAILVMINARKYIGSILWIFVMAIIIIAMAVVFTRDMGATLEHHGLFNLCMLIVMTIPLLIYMGTWLLAFKLCGKKKGYICQILFVNIFLAVLIGSKATIRRDWPIGMFGQDLVFHSHGVQIPEDFTPWQSLQPRGWNVILGQECPSQNNFATISDGLLVILCDDSNPYFIEYPNFLAERDDLMEYDLNNLNDVGEGFTRTVSYTGPTTTNAEVVQAFCGDDSQLLMQSIENATTVQRLDRTNQQYIDDFSLPHPPNILIMTIDALSRAHFYRRLTNTAKLLAEIEANGNASVYQFFRFHAMAKHTGPNTIPLYVGAPDLSWSSNPNVTFVYNETYNVWWKTFDSSKYVSAWIPGFCEDWSMTYLNVSFPLGAVDHMMSMPFCHPDAFPLQSPLGPFNGPYSCRRRCIGDRKVHTYSLQYASEFLANYKGVGKVATITFMEAHEGTMEIITQVDDDLAYFLEYGMGEERNNTFIFLLGDHGNHMSPYFLWTLGGVIENRLPMLFILTPPWFKERYPELSNNLIENANRLLISADLFTTITELKKLPEFGGNQTTGLKGLFSVLPDRGCKEAGIEVDMCVFEQYDLEE